MNISKQSPIRSSFAVLAVACLSFSACGSDSGSDASGAGGTSAGSDAAAAQPIVVTDAWSRQPAEGQSVGVVYPTLSNPNDSDVTVVSATSSVSDDVELHETMVDDDGTMSMQEKPDGFVIPAGGEFVFEPGGPHIMLLDIDPSTFPDTVDVTLEFDGADPVSFDAEVRAINGDDAMGEMDMGEMDMGEMDMGEMDHSDGTMADDAMSEGAMSDGATTNGTMADHDEHADDEDHDGEHGDHGGEHTDHGEHDGDHGEADTSTVLGDLPISQLHEVDEELADGVIDPQAQRAVVAIYLEKFDGVDPAPGTEEADLLDELTALDTAIEAGDVDAASAAATAAHDIAHDLTHTK